MRTYHVYVLASRSRRLYVGVTSALPARVGQHRAGQVAFTRKYRIWRLVHVESTTNVNEAIAREKQLKQWRREKKIALIEQSNPLWDDLAEGWMAPSPTLEQQVPPCGRDDSRTAARHVHDAPTAIHITPPPFVTPPPTTI